MNNLVDNLEDLAKLKIAQRCKTDLFYLAKNILGYDKMTEHTHGDLCDRSAAFLQNRPPSNPVDESSRALGDERSDLNLKDVYNKDASGFLILMPRGTFKSSVVTISATLQMMLNDPDSRVLIDSETYTKAKAFLMEIKGHLEGNAKYREIFRTLYGVYPDENKRNLLWSDSALVISARKRARKEPSISCNGVDKSINGMHYDLIIMDDVVSETNIGTKEQLDKVKQHYKLAWSLLDPGKKLIVIGTRWHYSDLYQHIIDNEAHRFSRMVRTAKDREGNLFFPEVLTEKELDNIRKTQGSSIFSGQYMNNPVDDENATFKREYFKYIDEEQVQKIPINWFLMVDPSQEGEYSDRAALVVAGMDYLRNIYVRHVLARKMRYSDIINAMFELYNRFKIRRISLETLATQKSIEYELYNEQQKRGLWLPVEFVKQRTKSKEERVRGLAPSYEFGHVFHVKGANQLDDLEYELLHFPKVENDDVIDAFADIHLIGSPPGHNMKKTEERERKVKKWAGKPRSPLTGV